MNIPMPESRYILPSFEERTAYGFKRQDPYAKLFEDRIIFLGVQVDDASADDIMAQLLVLESQDPDRDIVMYINSPGGSFTAMTAIYDTMQYIRPQIQTVVLGQAASAAAVIAAAGTPGKRLALPNARILIHQPAVGEAGRGQASDIEIQAKEILRLRTWLEETLVKHSNHDLAAHQQGPRARHHPVGRRGPRVRPDRPGADQPQEPARTGQVARGVAREACWEFPDRPLAFLETLVPFCPWDAGKKLPNETRNESPCSSRTIRRSSWWRGPATPSRGCSMPSSGRSR